MEFERESQKMNEKEGDYLVPSQVVSATALALLIGCGKKLSLVEEIFQSVHVHNVQFLGLAVEEWICVCLFLVSYPIIGKIFYDRKSTRIYTSVCAVLMSAILLSKLYFG